MPIGTLARRTGLAVSAIRFYESKGLLTSQRTAGSQRRFLRSDIRRLSFVMIAQRMGFSLPEIEAAMAHLPRGRTPSLTDWQRVSRSLREEIDARIKLLTRTRAKLDECIGCGCISLQRCQIFNRDDRASLGGTGPRFVLG
ncbi:MAG: redox-sensitive transcriptional activator SoxR [Novosphingobium sp.]